MAKEEPISQHFESQYPEEKISGEFWPEPIAKIKEIYTKLRDKISSMPLKKLITGKKITIILVLTILVIILVIAQTSLHLSGFKPPVVPSPSPTPFEEEIANPSAYATDSAVLEIEKRIKEVEKDIDKADLKETGLNPPVLDMEVNFKE